MQDISEYLASIDLVKPQGRVEGRVTYHDPCHLVRAQDVSEQPRKLLKMIDGLEFVEMDEADWCCGSAGTQIITHYETSMGVLDKKMANVAATEAGLRRQRLPRLPDAIDRRLQTQRRRSPGGAHGPTAGHGLSQFPPQTSDPMIDSAIIHELETIVGKKYVLTSQEDLLCYSFDGTFAEFMPRPGR